MKICFFSHFCCYSQNYHLAFCKNPSRSLARLYDDLIVFKAIIALNPVKVHFYSEFGGINSSINHHAQNNFNSNVIAIITTFSKIPWKYRQAGGRRYDGIRREGTIQTFVLWFEIFLVEYYPNPFELLVMSRGYWWGSLTRMSHCHYNFFFWEHHCNDVCPCLQDEIQ